MISSKKVVHSVICFLLTMIAMAGCYICLSAEFLAVSQLLIYAGGIVVMFLFVIMLVELARNKEEKLFQMQTPYAIATVLVGVFMIIGMFWKVWFNAGSKEMTLDPAISQGLNVTTQNAQVISRGLFANYILPFEILSVILLVALVGAVLLAKIDTV